MTRDGVTGNETKRILTETWLPLGTVTAVWDSENGYLTLYNVDGATEEEPVRIPLYTHLQSIAFVPQVIDTKLGMGVIDFYTITRQVNSSLPTTHRSPTV